jgi:signal transduction histidine kinase
VRGVGSLPARILLLLVLPLVILLLGVAFGGAALHTGAMREMVAARNLRAVTAASEGLVSQMAADTTPEQLRATAEQWLSGASDPSAGAVILLLNRQGRVLAHPNAIVVGADWRDRPGVASSLGGKPGSAFEYDSETSEDSVYAFSPVGESGWILLMIEPWSAVADPLLRYSQIAPLLLVPAFLMAAGALYFGVRQIVQPLQRLDAQATRLGWGHPGALDEPVGGIEEIQALQATLARMVRQLQAAQEGMRSYATALTLGQEDERNRLARELHDETVQTLIALEHQVHLLRKLIERDSAAAVTKAGELAEMANDAVREVRRIIRALRPLYLDDLGWLPAIQALVDDVNRGDQLLATFQLSGSKRRLEPAAELALFRTTQEALSNVVRHSGAQRAWVRVEIDEDAATLTVRDDGQGFAPPTRIEELASAGHFGLMGIQERAQLIGAQLAIESEPGKGTTISVTLPSRRTDA